MGFHQYDWIWETTTTAGTGDLTLAGAVAGWRAFSSQYADGDTFPYSIYDGSNYEEGLGTYHATPNTFSRTTVYRSSNGGAAVNWGTSSRNVNPCTLGVLLESLLTPGSRGVPVRSADLTWAYQLAMGTGQLVDQPNLHTLVVGGL